MIFTIFVLAMIALFGPVNSTPVLKIASPIAMAAAAATTDPNNVPGPMFCAPECQNIYDVCMGDGENPEPECRDMSCVSWGWECGECELCKA